MHKILVTGGTGYIGSHTIVDLADNGFNIISIDNHVKSDPSVLAGIEKIIGRKIPNYPVDLKDLEKTRNVFNDNRDISGIIHFAAYKSVPESVEKSLDYYENNLDSLINLLKLSDEFNVPHFIFSSSCSVYGNVDELPVTEETLVAKAESPYANTKKIGEDIIRDHCRNTPLKAIILRYFNPVGAHSSSEIGELPVDPPLNLVPRITQTAAGLRDKFYVYGTDYETRDGTCIRDYLHVMDIANAHTKALQYLMEGRNSDNFEVFNIGSGTGYTVLEIISAFEKVYGKPFEYEKAERREGDVVAIYANNSKASEKLKWSAKRDLNEMLHTAWEWQKKISGL